MANKSIAEMTADNAVLIAELSKMERGEVATYEEHFTKWLGKPVRNSMDMGSFQTVVKRLRKDYGIILSPVWGVGYRLLTDDEVRTNEAQIHRARHAASRRKKELGTVDISKLNDMGRLDWAAKVTQTHLIEEASGDKALKKLTAAANGAAQPLALAKALDAIKGNV